MRAKRPAQTDSKVHGAGPIAVLVIHGPNLNLLGEREPEVYGRTRLADIDRDLKSLGRELKMNVETYQSNSEGAIVDRIQKARGKSDVILINPGGYTHTSVAIRDAILGVGIPVIEVHLSNVYRRERFRHRSLIADIAHGRIMGFGAESYHLALRAARAVAESARPRGK
ncbi:MAG TPA: type II 3-dehydroquinate dehydratase [Candidatus Binataceae bacterium]|nr:type II 3-dehydroquinate dehydratase [Candidatus Binataceae bacterium]